MAERPSRRTPSNATQRAATVRTLPRPGAGNGERATEERATEERSVEAAKASRRPSVPRPRFRLTRRATILALAVCAVVVTIAYPFQEYLSQRSQLIGIDRQNAQLSQQVTRLQAQIALWSDPGYVAIQAREQLHYVRPGEEGFTVAGPANGDEQLGLPTPEPSPWYDKLWGSVKNPGAGATP